MSDLRTEATYYAGHPRSAKAVHYFPAPATRSFCKKARAVDCPRLTQVVFYDPDEAGVCVECARRQPKPAAYLRLLGTVKGGAA